MNEKEGMEFIERAEKMVDRLTKALYADDESNEVTGPMMMYAVAKFTAAVLLAIQEETYNFNVEEEYLEAVKEMMKVIGKDRRIQKIKNEREDIERQLAENEIKIEEYRKKVTKYEIDMDSMKHEKDMVLSAINDDDKTLN